MDAPATAIPRVGPAFHEITGGEAVEDARNGNGLDIQPLGDFPSGLPPEEAASLREEGQNAF
jgi:hypothetical protein